MPARHTPNGITAYVICRCSCWLGGIKGGDSVSIIGVGVSVGTLDDMGIGVGVGGSVVMATVLKDASWLKDESWPSDGASVGAAAVSVSVGGRN